jgi:hypothetical protein
VSFKPIDTEVAIQKYKVLMGVVSGYYIDVAASSPEEALEYAELNRTYPKYNEHTIEIKPIEVVNDDEIRQ